MAGPMEFHSLPVISAISSLAVQPELPTHPIHPSQLQPQLQAQIQPQLPPQIQTQIQVRGTGADTAPATTTDTGDEFEQPQILVQLERVLYCSENLRT